MTLLWMEGFELHEHVTALGRKYDAGSTNVAGAVFAAGRRFGRAMRAPSNERTVLRTPYMSGEVRFTQGMAFRMTGGVYNSGGGTWWLFGFYEDPAGAQTKLEMITGPSGTGFVKLRVSLAGNPLGESQEFPTPSNWNYLEWRVYLHASAGTVEVRLNQAVIISLTGINTGVSGNIHAEFGCGAETSQQFDIDDMYVLDDGGTDTEYQSFLGDVCVKGALPTSDGSPSAWTPSTGTDRYAVVDDAPTTAAPEDDYLSDTGYVQQMVGLNSLQEVISDVLGIQIDALHRIDAGPGFETLEIRHSATLGGTPQLIGAGLTNSTTPDYLSEVAQQDPATSKRFDIDAIAQGYIGVEKDF